MEKIATRGRAILRMNLSKMDKGTLRRDVLTPLVRAMGLLYPKETHLSTREIQERRGVKFVRVLGKGTRIRNVPLRPAALYCIRDYPESAEHGDETGPVFGPVKNPKGGRLDKARTQYAIYNNVVGHYAELAGIDVQGFCTHTLRATAAASALDNESDMRRSRNGLATRASQQLRSTIDAKQGRKTVRHSRCTTRRLNKINGRKQQHKTKASQLAARLNNKVGHAGIAMVEEGADKSLHFDVIDAVMCVMHSDGVVNLMGTRVVER